MSAVLRDRAVAVPSPMRISRFGSSVVRVSTPVPETRACGSKERPLALSRRWWSPMPTEPESPSVPALEIVVSPARVMLPATLAELLLLLRNAPA